MVEPFVAPALPSPVAKALEAPVDGERITVEAAGIPWSALRWGGPADCPLLLIHGVTSSAAVWWRVGPALAAAGYHVTAVDQAGHGLTGHWRGHHRLRDNAVDIAAFIRAAGLDRADLRVVGHSWGAATAAALPIAGIRPATLVLLDTPVVPYLAIAATATQSDERAYDSIDEARDGVRRANPDWSDGDVDAKAEALAQLDAEAARAVLLDNGDWDGGLADLREPVAADLDVWLVRGDPASGGYVPDEAARAFAAIIGDDHVITLAGAPHSPQRTHPVETTAALLRALGVVTA